MRRWMAGILACLLLSACGGAAADATAQAATPTPLVTAPQATPTSESAPIPTAAPIPTPTPTHVAPLTGLATDDPGVTNRPVLALKIDNHPKARPPTALIQADVVFEELVEGGVTRFIALYQSQVPDVVGPVRSGREVDADLLPAFDPVVGISGAAPVVYGLLWGADLRVFEEGQADGFFRRRDLRAPHNLFAVPENLYAAGEGLPNAVTPWEIAAEIPGGGKDVTSIHVQMSPYASADWRWDGTTGRWLRREDGHPHRDALGARQSAESVVIATVPVRSGTRTDAGGNPTVDIDVIGEGEATILRNGRAYNARWRKDSATSQFVWTTPAGKPLPLAPGRTWIELLPDTGSVTL